METALKRPWLILLVAIPTLAGCALTTARVDLAYLPDSAKKSPLSTLKPMRAGEQWSQSCCRPDRVTCGFDHYRQIEKILV